MNTVACVECHAQVPEAQVEMTGLGWRCRACSLRHQIDIHGGADDQMGQMSLEAMQAKADRARGLMWLAAVVGIACGVILAACASAGVSLPSRLSGGLVFGVPAGLATAAFEYFAWRRAERAVEIMRTRER